jgi:hypothetical protein
MARPQPGPARRADGGWGRVVAGICGVLATGILSGGLVVGVAHSPWGPAVVAAAGITAICVLASVPMALLGVVGVLVTRRGRRWLGEHIATALARRHHERMAAASPEQSLTQHLHVAPEMVPLNGGRRQS